MASVLDSPLEPGTVLAGKYRVERVIGQGGMGIVAAAMHMQLEQRVALKLMLPHAISSGEAVARFLREARAAARISSEHVARVFDVGSLETGEPYIAMEYLEGQDIAAVLASRVRLPAEESVDYLLQGCEALAEAHSVGIVHRDLKPGNLFLTRRVDGQVLVKVLDFGISKVTSTGSQSNAPATRTSALMGSPLYMSPEQMGSAKAVDARSDVWALGVVLYEMLCGQAPFNGETLPQVCAMVMSEAPPPLAAQAPGLPPRLYDVVQRCLEKQVSARYQSVAELAQALEPFATTRGRQSVQRILHVQGVVPHAATVFEGVAAPAVTGPSPPMGTYAPWGETKPPVANRRHLGALSMVAVGVVVLAASAAWLGLRSPPEPPAITSAAPTEVHGSAVATSGTISEPSATAAPSAEVPIALSSALPAASVSSAPPQLKPVVNGPRVAKGAPAKAASAAPPASPVSAPPAASPAAANPPVPASTRSRL